MAIALLRYAADEADALGKHPVSPGSIVPVREMLGDLYLELGRPADALASYEQSLTLNPARYRAIAGAGQAAEKAGRRAPRDRARARVPLGRGDPRQRLIGPAAEPVRSAWSWGSTRAGPATRAAR